MSEDVLSVWGPILLLEEEDAWFCKDFTLEKTSSLYFNRRKALVLENISSILCDSWTVNQASKHVDSLFVLGVA